MTDTAGMRQTLDPIEAEGVAVAHDTAEQADIVLSVHDCVTWLEGSTDILSDLSFRKQDMQNVQTAPQVRPNAITVLNKADELTQQQTLQLQKQLRQDHQCGVSQQQLKQQDGSQAQAQETQLQQHSDRQLQPHGLYEQQQQPNDSQQQLGAHSGMPPGRLTLQHGTTAAGMETRQLHGMHSMRTVLCSCKTGWNMDVLVEALEQGIQAIMQSGQESEEALVITRYSLLVWGACHWSSAVQCSALLRASAGVHDGSKVLLWCSSRSA